MLWSMATTFSAIHSAFISGRYVFISEGASVFGVFWNTIGTPSTVRYSMWSSMMRVGGISSTVPFAAFMPSPCPA